MKKIIFISNMDSFNNFYLYYYAKLSELGWTIDIASNGETAYDQINCKYNVCFGRTPFKLSNIKALFMLRKILSKNKYDIIFCNTPVPGAIARIALIGLKVSSKIIYSAHGYSFSAGEENLKAKLFIAIEKWLSRFTDVILTMNKEDYALSQKCGFKCKIIHVDGVGVEVDKIGSFFTGSKAELREKKSLHQDAFIIIYPAELSDRKNQALAFSALEQLKDLDNIIYLSCGKGPNLSEYERNVCEKKLPVKFLGFRRDVLELLHASDILLATSTSEGLPINVIEAMAAGLPIIATKCKGHTDLVNDNQNGYLFDFNDSKQAADYIRKLYYDKELYQKLSTQSWIDSQKYATSRVFAQYLAIFDALMGS